MGYYADLIKENKEKTNSLSEKAKQIISKAVAEARFDYRTAIDFAIADLKAEKEWAWTSQNEVSQMVQRLIKNRMDFGFNSDNSKKGKENAYAKLVKKLSDFDIYEDAEGYFMRVKDGKLLKGGYLSIRDAETDGHRAKSASKDNEKDNSILSTEMYKGYKIEVYKAKAGVDYGFNIYDKSGALFDWGTYFDSERDALRWAKLAIDRKNNSKEEEGYYAKLIEEKKNLTYDTEKLAKQVKTWLDTGSYSERDILEKLEKEHNMTRSVAYATLEKGKKLRAQG